MGLYTLRSRYESQPILCILIPGELIRYVEFLEESGHNPSRDGGRHKGKMAFLYLKLKNNKRWELFVKTRSCLSLSFLFLKDLYQLLFVFWLEHMERIISITVTVVFDQWDIVERWLNSAFS